ncbi:MAG: hydroxymethylbilane synthase [Bdellovibrionales bacterium]
MKKIMRLGTRGSPLALVQAQIVRDTMYQAYPDMQASCDIEIVPLRTSGDWIPEHKEQSFLDMGASKGMFTKEIEEALLSNMIDFAVHSMKDVSVTVPDGLSFSAILKRGDPRDALLSPIAPRLEDLPSGARVGTSSLRRRAQILALRPDLTVIPLRGNVDTRMKKLAAEEADATILAVAGLSRLGVEEKIATIFDTKTMLPAAAQGFLGIQTRENDSETISLVQAINDERSAWCCAAERAFLQAVDGSCRMPIAAYATLDEGTGLTIEGLVAKPDGSAIIRKSSGGDSSKATELGAMLGAEIKSEMSPDFFVPEA